MTDLERRSLFRHGFGHGAQCHRIELGDSPDYVEGWEAGREAAVQATQEFSRRHELGDPLKLTVQLPAIADNGCAVYPDCRLCDGSGRVHDLRSGESRTCKRCSGEGAERS